MSLHFASKGVEGSELRYRSADVKREVDAQENV